jgi:hypothetical protein
MLGRWFKRGEKHRANKQEGDVHALDREGDPRGGVQDEEYRSADPRDVVEAEGPSWPVPVELLKKAHLRTNGARKTARSAGTMATRAAGSSNGRTPDSGSGSQGSSPCPAASKSPLRKRAFASLRVPALWIAKAPCNPFCNPPLAALDGSRIRRDRVAVRVQSDRDRGMTKDL